MQLTIIRETNTVVIGGIAFEVDCSSMPSDVHAVQWNGNRGEVEYSLTRCIHCGARSKKGNELISDVTPYQPLVDAWTKARDEAMAKAKADEEKRLAALAEKASNAPGPQA